jgi:hypothetical protein
MTKLLTIVLAGFLALPLCSTGSVTIPSHPLPNGRKPVELNRGSSHYLPRTQVRRSSSHRSKSAVSQARTRADEPAMVILYGGHPWSWM